MNNTAKMHIGWTEHSLLDLAVLAEGQVDPRKNPYREMILVAPDHIEAEVGRLIEQRTAREQNAISGKYLFSKGDVIYSKIRPYLRKAVIAPFDGLCSADMYPLRPNKNVDRDFLLALILGDDFSRFAEKVSARTGIPKINRQELAEYRVTIPPVLQQAVIGAIHRDLLAIITKQNAIITLKEIRKRAIMQQLLSGKLRVPGFAGEWQVHRLCDYFTERSESGYTDLSLLSITADRGVIYQSDSDKRDNSNQDKSKYKRICVGDIGYNTMRMWQGRSALSQLEGIVSPAYTVITPKPDADALFFSYLFKTDRLINLFRRNSQGLVDDTLNCKFPAFASIKVSVPSIEEQRAIASILQTADRELDLLRKKLDLLKLQKKGLMQKLLTGQLQVPILK